MSGTITLPTPPAPFIDMTGIHVPVYQDYLAYLVSCYLSIYGNDTYLANDSQDGQLLSIFALALSSQASACIAAYNSFSPSSGQGVGLSSNVKINGISRKISTQSFVDLRVVGVAGTSIISGVASDGTNDWNMPALVTIPDEGEITVTAFADSFGAITANAETITRIMTPTAGWQTVENIGAAVPGQPIETDALLRRRQTVSTALPSKVILDGIIGALFALVGVTRVRAYENDTSATDSNGIPSHSLSMVIDGGNVTQIAQTIAVKKTPGAGTYGTTLQTVIDNYGVPHTIKFYRPTYVTITVIVNIHNLFGYTTNVGVAIKNAVVATINATNIGDDVLFTRLYIPAQLIGPYANPLSVGDPLTFELLSVLIARSGSPAAADVVIAFNEAAICDVSHVTLNVV